MGPGTFLLPLIIILLIRAGVVFGVINHTMMRYLVLTVLLISACAYPP